MTDSLVSVAPAGIDKSSPETAAMIEIVTAILDMIIMRISRLF